MKGRIFTVIAVLLMAGLAGTAAAATGGEEAPALLFEGACNVSWDCPAGACQAQVACSGTQSCSAAPDYVICDGNRTDCVMPDMGCVIGCFDEYMQCQMNCIPMPDPPPDPCGCNAERDEWRAGCCY
jgi:hypothetical protein